MVTRIKNEILKNKFYGRPFDECEVIQARDYLFDKSLHGIRQRQNPLLLVTSKSKPHQPNVPSRSEVFQEKPNKFPPTDKIAGEILSSSFVWLKSSLHGWLLLMSLRSYVTAFMTCLFGLPKEYRPCCEKLTFQLDPLID